MSRSVHSGFTTSHAHVSLLTAIWSHYVAHDLSRPVVSTGVRGERVSKLFNKPNNYLILQKLKNKQNKLFNYVVNTNICLI